MSGEGKTNVSNYEMNGNSFRNTMHSLNYGNVMEAAARNYMKEAEAEPPFIRTTSGSPLVKSPARAL